MPRAPNVTPPANSATMRAFVHWIRAAAPYVHAFRGKAFVIYWSWDGDDRWVRWERIGDLIH